MVPFYKRKKMEIFKLFNEWPKSPEKENKSKVSKCECSLLKNQVSERDAIIKAQDISIDESESKINYLNQQNEGMSSTISQLQENTKKLQERDTAFKNEIAYLKSERDKFKEEAEISASYLKNVEFSFNDVHSKYERTKTLIEELKVNENNLQKCIQLHEDTIDMLIEQYSTLKNYSMQQFEEANIYVNTLNQERESVITQLQSKIRKLEVTTAALEQSLQQKTMENEQLSIICDELINKQSTYYVHNVKDIVQAK